jgi:cytochrome P450
MVQLVHDHQAPNAFSVTDLHEHGVMRRAVSRAFSMTSLVELEEFVDGVVLTLLTVLDTAAEAGHPIDLSSLTLYFAMDVVGELAFGQSFNLLNDNKDTHGLLVRSVCSFLILVADVDGSMRHKGRHRRRLLDIHHAKFCTGHRLADLQAPHLASSASGGLSRTNS